MKNSLDYLKINSCFVKTKEEIEKVSGIILPGVGNASETMGSLYDLDLVNTLERLVNHGTLPFLGICIGMQVLFERSEEGNANCLGFIKGKVRRYHGEGLRVPQIGWNKISFVKDSPVNIPGDNLYMYFVNSYYCTCDDKADVLAVTTYGSEFTSMVQRDNIFGAQFHLEKSGPVGLRVLQRYCRYVAQYAKTQGGVNRC